MVNKLHEGTSTQVLLADCCNQDLNVRFPYVDAHCVYKLVGEDGLFYIGKSSNGCLSSRLRTHLNHGGSFNGKGSVRVMVACFTNEADCLISEIYLIAKYKPVGNKEVPKTQSTFNISPPTFELYTTVTQGKLREGLTPHENREDRIKVKWYRINGYGKRFGFTISYEEFKEHIIKDRINLDDTGMRGKRMKFNYKLKKFTE